MENFDLRKYLAEGKLLKEEIDINKISKLGDYNETEDSYKYKDHFVQKYIDGGKTTYAVFKDRGEKTDSYGSPDFESSDLKKVEDFLTGLENKTENIQDEDLLAKQAIDILDEFRVYAEDEKLIQYLNKSMDYLERIPSNDDVYSAIQAVADGLNLYTGEEFDYEVDEMQSELERLIN